MQCEKCCDTGERVIFDHRICEGYAIVFCDCITGKTLAANQSEIMEEYCE